MLILPGSPAFANCTDNFTGAPGDAIVGTSCTAGANNVDGAVVTALTALPHDVHFLLVGIGGMAVTAGDGQVLLDIVIDPAGGTSWSSLIDDLVVGFTTSLSSLVPIHRWYYFPIYIKSGSSLGTRARTLHTANIVTGRVAMIAFGNPKRPEMWWCGSKVESLGINAATSKGTDVLPGATGTYGSWTDIGGLTSGRYGAIQFGVNGSDALSDQVGYYWQFGYGSSKLGGSPTFYTNNGVNEFGVRLQVTPIWCDIPAGTQMQARGTATSTTIETHNVAIYGIF